MGCLQQANRLNTTFVSLSALVKIIPAFVISGLFVKELSGGVISSVALLLPASFNVQVKAPPPLPAATLALLRRWRLLAAAPAVPLTEVVARLALLAVRPAKRWLQTNISHSLIIIVIATAVQRNK